MLTLPVSYAVQGEKTSPKWASAFAAGCGGVATPDITHLHPGPFAGFCTPPLWPLLRRARADGRDWYYGDHGFFRRFEYYRVTKNGIQPSGTGTATADRFRRLRVDTQPGWNTGGSAIVICPNSDVYMREHGIDAHAWAVDLVERLGQLTDRPLVVRWKSSADKRPLYCDLHDAWLVVVYSSGAAIEALAAGVPVCTLAPWASTAHMGITDLAQVERPHYPTFEERDQFLFNLADSQWTLDEIRRGLAWRTLNPREVAA